MNKALSMNKTFLKHGCKDFHVEQALINYFILHFLHNKFSFRICELNMTILTP